MAADTEIVENLSGKINEFYKIKDWGMSLSRLRDKVETIGNLWGKVYMLSVGKEASWWDSVTWREQVLVTYCRYYYQCINRPTERRRRYRGLSRFNWWLWLGLSRFTYTPTVVLLRWEPNQDELVLCL